MKAIVQTESKPRSIAVMDRPIPEPGPTEVRIRVRAAGLCGSDVHAYTYADGYQWVPTPRIMGHEYAGVIDSVGRSVDSVAVGQHVIEEPVHSCGSCYQCENGQPNVCQSFEVAGMHLDGGYAEYAVVDRRFVHPVPEEMPWTHAAIVEPTSVATRAVLERSELRAGDRVLVLGPGPIGLLTAGVAVVAGGDVTVAGLSQDREVRLPIAERLGASACTVDSKAFTDRQTALEGDGYDIVFDATGHVSGLETAIDSVRKGGRIVVIGLPGGPSELSLTDVVRSEVTIGSSYGSLWRNFEQAIRLLNSGQIDTEVLIDQSYDVADPVPAFEAFLEARTGKPVFDFERL